MLIEIKYWSMAYCQWMKGWKFVANSRKDSEGAVSYKYQNQSSK